MKKAIMWGIFWGVLHGRCSGWPPDLYNLQKLSEALYALIPVSSIKPPEGASPSKSPSQGASPKKPKPPHSGKVQKQLPSPKPGTQKDVSSSERKHKSTAGFDAGNFEQRLHELINNERVKQGYTPLKWDPHLARAALTHTNLMIDSVGTLGRNNALSHNLPGESQLLSRFKAAGVSKFYKGAENIAYGTTAMQVSWTSGRKVVKKTVQPVEFEKAAQSMVIGWMNSPGHRKNILDPALSRGGIGVAFIIDPSGGNELVYATQNFAG